jgi:hypothetical protein
MFPEFPVKITYVLFEPIPMKERKKERKHA